MANFGSKNDHFWLKLVIFWAKIGQFSAFLIFSKTGRCGRFFDLFGHIIAEKIAEAICKRMVTIWAPLDKNFNLNFWISKPGVFKRTPCILTWWYHFSESNPFRRYFEPLALPSLHGWGLPSHFLLEVLMACRVAYWRDSWHLSCLSLTAGLTYLEFFFGWSRPTERKRAWGSLGLD